MTNTLDSEARPCRDNTVRTQRQLKQTARGGLWNLAGAAAAGLGGLLITWLVAYSLPPQTAGAFFTATSAFLIIAAVARLGTPTGVVYWVARLRRKKRHAALTSALWLALAPITALAFTVSAGLWTWAPLLADWWSTPESLVRVLAIAFPAAVLLETLLAGTRGFNQMRPTVLIDRLGRTGMQLGALAAVVLFLPATATSVTAAWALPFIPAAVLAAWCLYRQWQRGSRRRRDFPDRVGRGAFWGFTAPRALASVGQLALQRLDIILVGAMLGLAEAAVYTVATRFVIVGQMAASAIGTAIQPRIAAAMAESEYDLARRLYQTSTAWIVALTWPGYFAVMVLVDWYLHLFGGEYVSDSARLVVWILASAMLMASACGVVDSVLAMAGKTSWQLYNVLAALVVNIGLNLWLIPVWGIAGAAAAWAAAVLVNNAIPLLQLTVTYRLHPFGKETSTMLAATATVFGVVPMTVMLVAPHGWAQFLVPTALFLASAVWLSAIWRLRSRILLARGSHTRRKLSVAADRYHCRWRRQ
ncbi:oligosaccharide flippase family protein [Natronoglycomyces albus]|uniref:Polysaccharide biosynthesis protein n=1 Tax=Natronoglycomyces albus TaxID=2811108 RepID=A0A895XRM2_9ACTN|nr:oligosaccharide flippase family protein [Natronoglycomyces albus]QSB06173.1 polysaccharide biosynthesis protein [Natronoglycomyces albus]